MDVDNSVADHLLSSVNIAASILPPTQEGEKLVSAAAGNWSETQGNIIKVCAIISSLTNFGLS